MAGDEAIFQNDEPTSDDRLNRDRYAEAFARLAEDCKTPLVVGLYATWGVGKTSLMKLIEKRLDPQKVRSIWFDPWQHQFDENPVVALAHKLVETLDSNTKNEGKKILSLVASAFGSILLKSTTGLTSEEILKMGRMYEEERFQVRETRVRLREYFEKLVQRAKGKGGMTKRLAFFIDDLDRCMPEEAIRMLEALKLYLNLEGCVYFLGVDRQALEQGVKRRYEALEIKGVDYLDKIIQLPFHIPLIEPACMDSFITPLLPKELQSSKEIFVEGLGDNPRQVKRFLNTLKLNHQLAQRLDIPNYDPRVLALLLLIQLIAPGMYRWIALHPGQLERLKTRTEELKEIFDEFLARNERLRDALTKVELPPEKNLKTYIYLTRSASVSTQAEPDALLSDLSHILEKHKVWLQTGGKSGEKASLQGVRLKKANLEGANLERADLRFTVLFETNLRRAILEGADLRGAELVEFNLQGAKLQGANLEGSHLVAGNLQGAKLRGANLQRAELVENNLIGADLEGADLREADLSYAYLMEADFQGARLNGAKLMGANLHGAKLRGASLEGANLEGSKNITVELLSNVNTLYTAKIDPQIIEGIKRKYPHLLEQPKELKP